MGVNNLPKVVAQQRRCHRVASPTP